jgi:predicted cupin superfamily sugar epimerase
MTAEELISLLDLEPHPEGGYYRETYRSSTSVASPSHGESRNAVTDIYFLLTNGQVSRFHRVCHDEIWHFYSGSPLRLLVWDGAAVKETIIGEPAGPFKHVVVGGEWQAAESLGEYSLVGCTVAPGFDFADFQFLTDSSDSGSLPESFARFS